MLDLRVSVNFLLYSIFVKAAIDLGRVIAKRKIHVVYGGDDRRLSKLVSKAAFIRGNHMLRIIAKALKPLDVSLAHEL